MLAVVGLAILALARTCLACAAGGVGTVQPALSLSLAIIVAAFCAPFLVRAGPSRTPALVCAVPRTRCLSWVGCRGGLLPAVHAVLRSTSNALAALQWSAALAHPSSRPPVPLAPAVTPYHPGHAARGWRLRGRARRIVLGLALVPTVVVVELESRPTSLVGGEGHTAGSG
ncbi:hypothetical protein BJ912DRAFT_1098474 [Pholiota molesta]|nr:hypothetical protein BJ912DRAFT_1098474 [Pholiota molesta]